MICKKCNFENADDARFCASCGANLSEQAEAVEEVKEDIKEEVKEAVADVADEPEKVIVETEEEFRTRINDTIEKQKRKSKRLLRLLQM